MVHDGRGTGVEFPIEPYKIKMVERIRSTTREERERHLEKAGFNVFAIPADSLTLDLFTDSGTSAMSDEQWSRLMLGDEAYAGSRSFDVFEHTIRGITGYRHVIPTHQGRMAEHLLFSSAVAPGQHVPSSYHFDTARAHIEQQHGVAVDLLTPEGSDISSEALFKGNMDVGRLEAFLVEHRGNVPLATLTVTNNAGGGQPVSMENIRAVREITKRHGVPLFFDAARFAENAWFIRHRERGHEDRPIIEIAREMFSMADGCTMSAKKDGLANIGGFVALNDDALAAKIKTRLILLEGFPTYGGLAGRDLEAVAQGLQEVVDHDYLTFRIGQVRAFGEALASAGVPVVRPFGGHAVYVDARRFLPHIPPAQFPAQAVVVELYRRYGIRACEFGSLTFSTRDPATGAMRPPALDLVRLAVPRRVYTESHLKFAASSVVDLFKNRDEVRGLRIEWEAPFLRHFTARLAPAA
jgi:tyrosine phenol-lyase